MSEFRKIINSLFDSRSSGMMIMDYIETPKEEYKKRFDMIVKDISNKKKLKSVMFTDDEISKLIDLLYNKLRYGPAYEAYKYEAAYNGDNNSDVMFRVFYRRVDSHDHNLLIRFKRMYDDNKERESGDIGDYVEREKKYREANICFNKLINSLDEGLYKKVYKTIKSQIYEPEMSYDSDENDEDKHYASGQEYNYDNDEEQYDPRTEEEKMIDYCLSNFYNNDINS